MKALSLVRLGRDEEAAHLCDEVKAEKPSDEVILQTLTMVYKSQSRRMSLARVGLPNRVTRSQISVIPDDQITQVYESAFQRRPNDEELANHWFMAIVRLKDFKTLQQVRSWSSILRKSHGYLIQALGSHEAQQAVQG